MIRLVALLLLLATPVGAHPGRLNAEHCHQVRHDYVSKSSGAVFKAGEYHCHRRLDQGMKVDGSERLRDEGEEHQPEPDEQDLNEAP